MRALRIGIYGLVGVICSAAMFAAYRHYKGDQLLSVQTGSMVPAFYPGDALVTRTVALSELRAGDIVAYRNPRNPKVIVSHRLIGINYQTGRLITHGDALQLQDVPFPAHLVVGKVAKTVPKLGLVLDFMHRPVGLIAVVYTPAAFILVGEARRLARQYRRPYYQLYSYGLKHR